MPESTLERLESISGSTQTIGQYVNRFDRIRFMSMMQHWFIGWYKQFVVDLN